MKKYDWESFDGPYELAEFLNANQPYFVISVTVSVTGNWTVFYFSIINE
jgi:hypothetical protein